jgi:hypothetical protein
VGEGIGKKLFVGSISDRSFKMTTDNGRPTTFYVESSGIAYWDNLIRSSSQYSLRNTNLPTQGAAAATAARAFFELQHFSAACGHRFIRLYSSLVPSCLVTCCGVSLLHLPRAEPENRHQ